MSLSSDYGDRFKPHFNVNAKWPRLNRCIPGTKHSDNVRGWRMENEEIVGEGCFGRVYKACRNDDCRYVLKNGEVNENEVILQQTAAKYNISKPIRDRWFCKKVKSKTAEREGVIITDALVDSLYDWVRIHKKDSPEYKMRVIREFSWQAIRKIGLLHTKATIMHKDIKEENVMLDEDDTLYLIDYGESKKILWNDANDWYNFSQINRDWVDCGIMFRVLYDSIEDKLKNEDKKINDMYVKIIRYMGYYALWMHEKAIKDKNMLSLKQAEKEAYTKLTNIDYDNIEGIVAFYENLTHAINMTVIDKSIIERTSSEYIQYAKDLQRKGDWNDVYCCEEIGKVLRYGSPPHDTDY